MVRAAGAFLAGRSVTSLYRLANMPQGHSVDPAIAAFRPVAAQLQALTESPAPDDPGAPVECLDPDLAPGQSERIYRI